MQPDEKDKGVPKRRLGKTNKKVSILCAGGYHIGRMQDERYAVRTVHAALDEGVNFLLVYPSRDLLSQNLCYLLILI